jgi:drug/metabolite transporter (DMT)-like permease
MKSNKTRVTASPFFADAMLFIAVLGWAISFPIAKIAMDDWGRYKFFFLAGRFWLAFAIFAILASRKCSWQKLAAHAKPGFWVGITLVGALGLQYTALRLISSGEVAFLTALSSVLVPIGLWVAFKKKVSGGTWFGLVVATVGAVLVTVTGTGSRTFSINRAAWLAFLAAVGLAAYIILIGHFMSQKIDKDRNKYEKVPFLTMQFLVVAIATTLLSMFTEVRTIGLPAWSYNAVFGMVFMSIVATAGAFFIQTKYQALTSPDRAALVFTLESPFAGLFGYLVLGEAFTSTMVMGAALIFLGVATSEVLAARNAGRASGKPHDPPSPAGSGFAEVLPERLPVLAANASPILATASPAGDPSK